MNQRQWCILGLFCSMLVMQGCVKEDLSKISGDYNWEASFSLPVTSVRMTSESFRGGTSLVDLYKAMGMVIYTETVSFDMSDIFTHSEYVDSLMLRFDIHNNFPAQIEVYAYYMDEYGRVVRNVLSDTSVVVEKPVIGEDGSLSQIDAVLLDEKFTKEDIPTLLETKQILLRVFITDLDLSPAVLNKLDESSIDITIGLRSAVNIPVDKI